ncbi:NLRC3, partial [Symbiodinium necroappetens]
AWTGKVRIKGLASQLTTNSGTTRLELENQHITAEVCQALADGLKSNCTVTRVNLDQNDIRNQGAKAALADALKSNCTVTHVNLDGNLIRDEGAKALADALQSNSTVTH